MYGGRFEVVVRMGDKIVAEGKENGEIEHEKEI